MKRINRSLKGRVVIFKGYDGKDYTAYCEKVQNGVAVLLYQITRDFKKEWVKAPISDPSRIVG